MPAVQTQAGKRLTKDAGLLIAMQHPTAVYIYPDADVPGVLDPGHQNAVALPGRIDL